MNGFVIAGTMCGLGAYVMLIGAFLHLAITSIKKAKRDPTGIFVGSFMVLLLVTLGLLILGGITS